MRYFTATASWDFPLANLDPDAHVLFSPTTFPPVWTYPYRHPKTIILDSGAFHHNQRNPNRGRLRALTDQLRIAAQFPTSHVTLTHCDVMLRDPLTARAGIDETLRNAEWFMAQPIESSHMRMTVAQARAPEEMYLVVSQLTQFQPDSIGLGGLAHLHRSNRALLPLMIEAAVEAAGRIPLHALGVTAAHVIQRLKSNGVTSCDSATPIRNAIYGSLIYSHPYRRYRLISEKSTRPEHQQETGYYTAIPTPLPCPCPACRDDPDLLRDTGAWGKHARHVHNYYHVKLEIEGAGAWQEAYLSAEYPSVMQMLRSSTALSPRKVTPPSGTLPAD